MKKIEDLHQFAVIQYLNSFHKNIKFTICPQGFKLSLYQAGRIKKLGYMAGVPDILIFSSRKGYHGLMIELKRPEIKAIKQTKGSISSKQIDWIDYLNAEGYLAKVCYGSNEAINFIQEYLK